MNENQEKLFNEKFKDLLINIKCFKHIFLYACNIFTYINKININFIINELYKNNFNYSLQRYIKNNYTYKIYNFKYFKLIIINKECIIKLRIKLTKNFNNRRQISILLCNNTKEYISNYEFKYKILTNKILYLHYKHNYYYINKNVYSSSYFLNNYDKYNYLYKNKYKFIYNNILLYRKIFSSYDNGYTNCNKIYLKFIFYNKNKKLKLNKCDFDKEINLIRCKFKIYYNYYNNINFFEYYDFINIKKIYLNNKLKSII